MIALAREARKRGPMSTNPRTTVQLGDLVVVAFDWAAQISSDPRDVPLLAAKAVEHLLRRARKEPVSRQFLPSVGSRELLAFEGVGRQPRALTITGGGAGQ